MEVIDGRTYVDGILIVNKKYSLPSDYDPGEDAEAGAKVRELISDMQNLGYSISDYYSGYRTYQTQEELYNNYVANSGQEEADTYSARPGYSEHQTGLVFDLCNEYGELVTEEEESEWIASNAWKYGFIVRYPEGKEDITGYMPEPWHLRYVGEETAKAIYEADSTLEEYLDVEGGDYAA